MATFVLVHGAWHGGWCWKKVAPLLRAAGHEVYTPTLTGLGERAHLLTREVDLDTHIPDVVNVLEYEDLRDVILVGHSYGGHGHHRRGRARPRAHRAPRLPRRLRPARRPGLALAQPAGAGGAPPGAGAAEGDGWRVPAPPAAWYGVTPQRPIGLGRGQTGPQPLRGGRPARCASRTPPRATRPTSCTQPVSFQQTADQARQLPGWRYRELPTGHDAMITAPEGLSRLLLGLVG